ncbi:hypothetical protein [Phenylobacterium sp.]|uniref:hypothetical protein n=1 Tax=Phenylobacterium sp. TaxID=1871053 RepID=UPI003BA8BEB2
MTNSRLTALANAKAMVRTLTSAPDPHARARAIFADLARTEGWSKPDEARIVAFGDWLATRPPPSALKDRCKALLKTLD